MDTPTPTSRPRDTHTASARHPSPTQIRPGSLPPTILTFKSRNSLVYSVSLVTGGLHQRHASLNTYAYFPARLALWVRRVRLFSHLNYQFPSSSIRLIYSALFPNLGEGERPTGDYLSSHSARSNLESQKPNKAFTPKLATKTFHQSPLQRSCNFGTAKRRKSTKTSTTRQFHNSEALSAFESHHFLNTSAQKPTRE